MKKQMTDLVKNMQRSVAYSKESETQLYVDDNNLLIPDNKALPIGQVANNGRAHTKNVAPIEHRYFLHRSLAEAYFTEACIQKKVLFTPLPVLGFGLRRIETDFLIFQNQKTCFCELDGPMHRGIPQDIEEARLAEIKKEGFKVIRFELPPVPEVSLKWAMERLEEVLNYLGRAA